MPGGEDLDLVLENLKPEPRIAALNPVVNIFIPVLIYLTNVN